MNRKHIDISAPHNLKTGEHIYWVHTVPASNFRFMSANGITMAWIARNYYLDQKTDKIRYSFMSCEGASYDHMYTLYAEVYPGILARYGVATEGNFSAKVQAITASVKRLSEQDIADWCKDLVRY